MSKLAILGGSPVCAGSVPAWPRMAKADEEALLAAEKRGDTLWNERTSGKAY